MAKIGQDAKAIALKMAKIGHDAKDIAFAKWSVWLKTLKCPKGAKNDCTSILKLLCAKNRPKKLLILEKWEHFENGQNWPGRKGYSLCKMVSLAENFKMPKRCEKRLYKHIKVVVCKKRSKKYLIFENWAHFKNGQNWARRKGYSLCKMVSLAQKLKMAKRCEKLLYEHSKDVACKKLLQKTPNIGRMRAFWKWPKLATTQRLYIAFAKLSVRLKN